MSRAEGPPLLEWILRANGALGAWLVGLGNREAASPVPQLSDDLERSVRARLDHHRLTDGQAIERLDAGTLVYASLEGTAAGLLLPAESSADACDTALRDLARLLDFEHWRPVLSEVTRQQDQPGESVDSVALRLAHQLERSLGLQVCVAVPHSTGVRIAGVSLRSDRRLLGLLVQQGCALDRVARGRSEALLGVQNPMGGTLSDRRSTDPAFVCAIPGERHPVGAVALWTPGGKQPTGPALADLRRNLDAAGPRLASAIEHRALAEAALRDPLTGLLNRAGLQTAMGLVGTTGGALIYADLDHFKALNDELGHPAGDSALVHVANLLLRAVRAMDSVARIGGEEFALWLPGISLERGRQVAERIRQAVVWSDWQWQGGRRMLSASFGVAGWPETSATVEGLAGQADAALYEAKRTGRGRVVVASVVRGNG